MAEATGRTYMCTAPPSVGAGVDVLVANMERLSRVGEERSPGLTTRFQGGACIGRCIFHHSQHVPRICWHYLRSWGVYMGVSVVTAPSVGSQYHPLKRVMLKSC